MPQDGFTMSDEDVRRMIDELRDQVSTLQSVMRAQENELSMIRSVALKDNLRAEQADQYEQWLLDIGKLSGCGHVDDRLPSCIREAFDDMATKLDQVRQAIRDKNAGRMANGAETCVAIISDILDVDY